MTASNGAVPTNLIPVVLSIMFEAEPTRWKFWRFDRSWTTTTYEPARTFLTTAPARFRKETCPVRLTAANNRPPAAGVA